MAKYNLQNRGSNLSRMGVEQKPLFVTQVDKLEAKIQVRKIHPHQPKICSSLKSFHPQALCHASLLGRQSSYSPYSQVICLSTTSKTLRFYLSVCCWCRPPVRWWDNSSRWLTISNLLQTNHCHVKRAMLEYLKNYVKVAMWRTHPMAWPSVQREQQQWR